MRGAEECQNGAALGNHMIGLASLYLIYICLT